MSGAGATSPAASMTGWGRFRRNRQACLGGAFLLALAVVSAVALPWSLAWFDAENLATGVRHGPSMTSVTPAESLDREVGDVPAAMRPLGSFMRGAASWLGHDDLGRSLLFRLALGLIVSLAVAAGATATALVVGTLWGAVAGLLGGRTDLLLMRVVDVLYGLPYILMVILMKVALTRPLTAALGGRTRYADLVILFLAIGSVSWLTMARVVRGLVMSLRHEGFVEASRAMGAGPVWIFRRHMLPNLVGPVAAYASLVVPQAVLQEAFLSFLGIGVQPPLPSLGRLAADGVQAINPFVGFWWLLVFPCGLLALMLLALNGVGEGLREALDPRSSRNMLA